MDIENQRRNEGYEAIVEEPPKLRVMQLFVKARNLKNMDTGRDKSDTQCVLYMKWHANQQDWSEVDHTEVIHDNLDPAYSHHFDVIYNFGQMLMLKFEINDLDSNGTVNQIGFVEVSLAELLKLGKDGQFESILRGEFPNAGFL